MSGNEYDVLFNPTVFKVKLGYRDYDFYLIEPPSLTKSIFLKLLSYIEALTHKNNIVLVGHNKLIDGCLKDKGIVYVKPKSYEQSLADSITKCMVIRLSGEILKSIVPIHIEPIDTLVIASRGIITYLCSKLEVDLNSIPHGLSLDTQVNYTQYNNLWNPLAGQDKPIDRIGGAFFYFCNIGVNVNIKDTKNAHILDTTFYPKRCPFLVWFSGFQCASLGLPA